MFFMVYSHFISVAFSDILIIMVCVSFAPRARNSPSAGTGREPGQREAADVYFSDFWRWDGTRQGSRLLWAFAALASLLLRPTSREGGRKRAGAKLGSKSSFWQQKSSGLPKEGTCHPVTPVDSIHLLISLTSLFRCLLPMPWTPSAIWSLWSARDLGDPRRTQGRLLWPWKKLDIV